MSILALDPGADWATAEFQNERLYAAAFQDFDESEDYDVLVVEFPKWYDGSDATPNTIIRLAWKAGLIAGRVDARMVAEVPTVAIPKSVIRRRVREALDETELDNLDASLREVPAAKAHNVYDAVRHGLVYLARMRA